ncbi:hypothetical protein HF325_005188 [Metschnikowia pulcherrima]|uniref:RlpA-like protein double-psi beta-barrel domain-containing protein n=1 Tax=Metschnikowia pulcherrima TaxID=27326 RepID=A0A8H7GPS2_9ASCO|nr:hypothetical protein HF325_005188 [Metschnikowia pulcherrima]
MRPVQPPAPYMQETAPGTTLVLVPVAGSIPTTTTLLPLATACLTSTRPEQTRNENTLCGKKIRAYYQGKSVEVTAVDRCEGCKPYDIDFSPAAFSQLADQLVGRIKITWEWI